MENKVKEISALLKGTFDESLWELTVNDTSLSVHKKHNINVYFRIYYSDFTKTLMSKFYLGNTEYDCYNYNMVELTKIAARIYEIPNVFDTLKQIMLNK